MSRYDGKQLVVDWHMDDGNRGSRMGPIYAGSLWRGDRFSDTGIAYDNPWISQPVGGSMPCTDTRSTTKSVNTSSPLFCSLGVIGNTATSRWI